MPICKFCGGLFQWGQSADGAFVPLVPIEEHDGVDRTFQDENGVLRARHLCRGGGLVRVAKLAKPIPAKDVIRAWTKPDPDTGETRPVVPSAEKKRRKRRSEPVSHPYTPDRSSIKDDPDDDIPF